MNRIDTSLSVVLGRSFRLLVASSAVAFMVACGGGGGGGGIVVPKDPEKPSAWRGPEPLTGSAGLVQSPDVAVGPAGDAVAVWTESTADGQRIDLWYRRYSPGVDRWGEREQVAQFEGSPESPRVAVDANGVALVVWEQRVPQPGSPQSIKVWARRIAPPGGSDDAAFPLDVTTSNGENPRVAVDQLGRAMVVWTRIESETSQTVQSRRYVGGQWDPSPIAVEPPLSAGVSWDPELAMNAAGDAVVVWKRSRLAAPPATDKVTDIWARRYTVDGNWSEAELIEPAPGLTFEVSVAINSDRQVAVAWDLTFDRAGLRATTYRPGQGWEQPVFVIKNPELFGPSQRIALDREGNTMMVWQEVLELSPDQFEVSVRYARRPAGESTQWEVGGRVDPEGQGWVGTFPHDMRMTQDGRALVVWSSTDTPLGEPDVHTVRARVYTPGTGWDAITMLETSTAGQSSRPAVSVNESGMAVALWSRSGNGSDAKLFASVLKTHP